MWPAGKAGSALNWEELVRSIARDYQRLGLDHPALFPSVLERPFGDPASIAALETVLRAFRQAGYAERATYLGFSLLTSFVEGFTLVELHRRGVSADRHADAAVRPGEDQMTGYPAVHAVFTNGLSSDETFELCLDLVIQALAPLRGQPG